MMSEIDPAGEAAASERVGVTQTLIEGPPYFAYGPRHVGRSTRWGASERD